MGNHRFRWSDMMPNAWFYKLKDMNKASSTKRLNQFPPSPHQNQKQLPPFIPNRASYYFSSNSPLHPKALDTHFPPDPPRKSSRIRAPKKPISPRLISSTCNCRNSTSSESECIPESFHFSGQSAANDIILNVGSSVLELPPIITKPPRKEIKKHEQQLQQGTLEYKKPGALGFQRLRRRAANSPRLVNKKVRVVQRSRQRKSLSDSFAVVKNSSNPKEDFRKSMLEMIMENNLRASRDLEELLACYLSLNSNEYHDVIVKVFEEIWFDLTDSIRL